jgi:alpha/beta superfamily hydrolase
MTQIEPVTFSSSGSHPVQLEGRLHLVEGRGTWPAAVVCHPHPLGGGTMHNGLVSAMAQALARQGVLALRFNFRGVGASQGQHDRGRGEQADVAGALDWLLARPEVDPWRVSVVGYSFGAWVGLSQAQADPRVAAVAAVGLVPWQPDLDLNRLGQELGHFAPDFLSSFARPKLFISGAHDAFAPPSVLRALVDVLPPPKRLHIVPDTDHFFGGHEAEVGQQVAEFLGSL